MEEGLDDHSEVFTLVVAARRDQVLCFCLISETVRERFAAALKTNPGYNTRKEQHVYVIQRMVCFFTHSFFLVLV